MTVPPAPGRRSRPATVGAIAVLVVLAGFVWVLATSDPSLDTDVDSPLLGRPAPPTEATTIDGGEFALAERRGEWVVVNFFATWCTPCRREHPELVAFAERHREAGDASVVSVVFDEQTSTAIEFFEENGGDWPVLPDETGELAFAYGVAKVPESFVVAPDGTVVAKLIGGVTADGLDRIITAEGRRA